MRGREREVGERDREIQRERERGKERERSRGRESKRRKERGGMRKERVYERIDKEDE